MEGYHQSAAAKKFFDEIQTLAPLVAEMSCYTLNTLTQMMLVKKPRKSLAEYQGLTQRFKRLTTDLTMLVNIVKENKCDEGQVPLPENFDHPLPEAQDVADIQSELEGVREEMQRLSDLKETLFITLEQAKHKVFKATGKIKRDEEEKKRDKERAEYHVECKKKELEQAIREQEELEDAMMKKMCEEEDKDAEDAAHAAEIDARSEPEYEEPEAEPEGEKPEAKPEEEKPEAKPEKPMTAKRSKKLKVKKSPKKPEFKEAAETSGSKM